MKNARPAKDWAKEVGVPYNTVLQSIKAGDLEAFRFTERGTYFVTPEAIQSWLENAKRRARG